MNGFVISPVSHLYEWNVLCKMHLQVGTSTISQQNVQQISLTNHDNVSSNSRQILVFL